MIKLVFNDIVDFFWKGVKYFCEDMLKYLECFFMVNFGESYVLLFLVNDDFFEVNVGCVEFYVDL